jgi:hypothetical protein
MGYLDLLVILKNILAGAPHVKTFDVVSSALRKIDLPKAVSAAPVFTPPTRCSMLCHVPGSHATYTVQSAGNWAAVKSAISGAIAGHRSGFVFNPLTVTACPCVKARNENRIQTAKRVFTGFSLARKSGGLASYWLPLSLMFVMFSAGMSLSDTVPKAACPPPIRLVALDAAELARFLDSKSTGRKIL